MEKISFVIPCYGSEKTIRMVVEEIMQVMASQQETYTYEIILVNDSSPDNVWVEIQKLANEFQNITGICLAKNFGQHAALMAGYRSCNGDIIVSLDDDGQTPVDEVFSLIDKIHEGYDVVYGSYPVIKQNPFRRFGSWVNAKMTEMMLGKPKELKGTSYYAARRFVIREMIQYHNPYPYVGGLVLQSTHNVTDVPVTHRARQSGHSGYSIKKLLKLWMNGFTAFSEKPLRVATIIGLICSMMGFISGVALIIRKIVNPSVLMGYSSTMATILFIGGIIMLLLGMIGEYVGRIYISMNNAPQYVIREMVGNQADEAEGKSKDK